MVNKLMPSIRFVGFTDAWEQRKLGKELSLLKDGTHGTHKDVDQGPYLLSAKNIKNGKINISKFDRKISFEDYYKIHKNFVLKKNDILLTIVGSIGESDLIKDVENITFQRSVAYLRPKNINAQFLRTLIDGQEFQNELKSRQVVSAQPGIYLGDLSKISIVIAENIEEQTKIGNFFKQLDETIALHQRELDLLKEQKKGFLQKMFPKKGETVPEIRFAGYTDAWEQRKLKNEMKKICVGFVGTCEKYYTNETMGIPMYRTSDLKGNELNHTNLKYVTKEFHMKNKKSQLKYGDLLIARHGDNGKSVVYLSKKEANCLNIVIISPDVIRTNSIFLSNYINSPYISNIIQVLSAGSTQNVINTKSIEQLNIFFPILEEQTHIGNFFKQLDDTIALHQRKLDLLKELKKGYLQKMFV